MKSLLNKYDYYFLKILEKAAILRVLNLWVKKRIYKTKFIIPILGKTGLTNLLENETWLFCLLKK